MQATLGRDLGHVRVHTGDRAAESATAIQAQAYTVGSHVVFGPRQYAPGSGDGQRLLAHELTHVAQQPDAAAWIPGHLRLGDPDSAHERQAARNERVADAPTGGLAGTIQRQPKLPSAPDQTGALNLTIGDDGKVSVTVAGPNAPVVSNPTIGIRRNPDGKYDLLVGGRGKTVAASEIPGMLRGALGGDGKKPGEKPQEFYVPTCAQLRSSKDGRYFTFDEYKVNQMLTGKTTPLTPAFYDALIENCRPKPQEIDVPPATPPQEAVPPVSPEGTAVA
jgi:hypothetical protein